MSRHRRLAAVLLGSIVLAFVLAFSGCTTILGDFEIAGSEAGTTGTSGRVNGEACQVGPECGSGFCVDGVCCDTACDGLCESCAAPTKGQCSPVPANTDPDKECLPEPLPDAGTKTVTDAEAGDGGGDGAREDAGTAIHAPDGGLTSNDVACAGTCDGHRKCRFPGRETACGTQFCNSEDQGAGFSCDAKGHCSLELTECGAFACQGTSCKKACTTPTDCADTHFCNEKGTCQERLGNGVACALSSQCESGFCVDGVCCNSECSSTTIPGATCKKTGSEGTCECSLPGAICPQGCRLFYPDNDKDKHGDMLRPLSDAKIGCVGDLPPVGYADVRDDCNDDDARVFPGQTAYFETPANGSGSFDFDCNGAISREIAEYPRGTCGYCGEPDGKDCPRVAECKGTAVGAFTCTLGKGASGYICLPGRSGFTKTVPCGDVSDYVTCGSCTKGIPTKSTSTPKPQRCR